MAINIRGIDVSGINSMKNAIETYRKTVIKKVNNVSHIDEGVINRAIKGTTARTEYNAMVQRANNNAKKLINKLAEFETALDGMKNKYTSSDKVSGKTSFSTIAK
mgnify:CR=1 FL=1